MTVLDLLYALLIGPLELFFEVLYSLAYQVLGDPGLSIIFLSLAMNFLVLPLYRRADAIQEAEREHAAKMQRGTDHIKKTFSGDERFMVLQTYNRQMGYKPTDPLKGSVSLLLEIPFFIAAYNFLSNLPLLHGVSFGPIADLGAPDALLQVAGVSINVLPLLMTAINVVSAFIYLRGFPLRSKVQTYGIAAIFLVLLYGSPSGLVFYWTLNNLFSLVKNIVYKLKARAKAKAELKPEARKGRFAIPEATRADSRLFVICGLVMAVVTGALIPASVIQASPAEFVTLSAYETPLWYIARSLALAVGTFVIWAGVFYWLASPKGKTAFTCAMLVAVGISVIDYLFFGMSLGNLSPSLQFEDIPAPLAPDIAANLAAVAAVGAALLVLWKFKKKAAIVAGASLCVAAVVISGVSAVGIEQSLASVKITAATMAEKDGIRAPLSKDGRNVVVIMMDRAIGQYIPFLLNEKPELQEKMAGFTYYPNATSYGICTNVGSPGLYGGYDYIPERMNERADTPLVEKHDEALKVMPTLFSQNGYDVTFLDPSYAGYEWVPDLRIFDDLPDVNAFITSFGTQSFGAQPQAGGEEPFNLAAMHSFFCYSLFKVAPTFLQPLVYHGGDYNSASALSAAGGEGSPTFRGRQVTDGASKGRGVDSEFMKPYTVLKNLPAIAPVEDGSKDTLLIMANDTAHSPTILEEPAYEPAEEVDNTAFDAEHVYRYAQDGRKIRFPKETGEKGSSRLMHYQVNMAALRELCAWFDYLRENGAYDNTRIIIVSDHARNLYLQPDLCVKAENDVGQTEEFDLLTSSCLLLVKDFDAEGFTVDERFMTNADTPTIATAGLIEDPVNPYTGNPLDSSQKDEAEQHVLLSWEWDTAKNNGTTFLPGYWFSVHDNIYSPENWEYLGYY